MAKITDVYNNKAYYQHIYADEETNSAKSRRFYDSVTKYLQNVLSVRTVLDVGCATGMVVSGFRDLGIEAFGIDPSAFAISQVREQDKDFVRVQSVFDALPSEFPQHFDLVTCIEVAEHIPEEQTQAFIQRLCELGDYVVFSSSPHDLEDRTHYNVQQQEYWCKRFAEQGFYRCMDREMTLPTVWTICFTALQMEPPQIVEAYERRDRINKLMQSKPKEYLATIYFDYGQGFDTEHPMSVPYTEGEFAQWQLNLEDVKSLRLVPTSNRVCMATDLHLNLRFATLSPARSNGIEIEQSYLFAKMDPYIDFELKDLQTDRGELSGRFYIISEDNTIACNMMNLEHRLEMQKEECERQKILGDERLEQLQKLQEAKIEEIQKLKEHYREEQEKALAQERACILENLKKMHSEEMERLEKANNQQNQERLKVLEEKVECQTAIMQAEKQAHDLCKARESEYREQINKLEAKLKLCRQNADEVEKQWAVCQREVNQITEERDALQYSNGIVMNQRDEAIRQKNEAIGQRDAATEQSRAMQASLDAVTRQRDEYFLELDGIVNGFWWRFTKPGRRITGKIKPVLVKVRDKLYALKAKPQVSTEPAPAASLAASVQCASTESPIVMQDSPAPSEIQTQAPMPILSVAEQFKDTGNPVWAIPSVIVEEPVRRLNLVTDTIEGSSLLGGVATALIVATQFCVKYDYELRIITRTAQPTPMNYENILSINDLERPRKVTYYSDYTGTPGVAPNFKMEITRDDIFFATSWWSAESIRKTTLRKRFFYIIQEAETFFYNYGGERRMCEEIMHDPNIDYIINSAYLAEYFKQYEPNVYDNGVAFEPAFSKSLYHLNEDEEALVSEKKKLRMFFYGRPFNPRNLFNYGVNILDKAIHEQVIDTDEWEICFAGANVPPVTFCDGSQSVNMGQMSWTEYAKFLQSVDLALCLMYTPHPSYPPYDVACSGGVVVTNKYLTKQDFSQCKNVIMSDLTDEGLLEGLRAGIELAKDMQKRQENYHNMTIPREWTGTLEETMQFMKRKL